MISRDKLIAFIDKTLNYEPGKDPWLFNSLQVVGKDNIKKIALGVSPNLELFKIASLWEADMIILHHGLLGPKIASPITRVLKNRLKILFDHDMTLLTYHLFLDCHPTLGNNSQIIKLLGARQGEKFGLMENLYWGYEGQFSKPITAEELVKRTKQICGPGVRVFSHGPKAISKIAVVSGGGPYNLREAADKKLDAYLTGEAVESSPAWAKEAGLHFLCLGHYNSEKFGIQALGKVLKKNFPQLEIRFIDVPNDL